MFQKPALYLIEQVSTGLVYAGGTGNLSKRWSTHRYRLRKGIHGNPRLQAAYDRDGPGGLRWRVLAVVPEHLVLWYEQRLLDRFQPGQLLNAERVAKESGIRGPGRVRAGVGPAACGVDHPEAERRCRECQRAIARARAGVPLDWPKGKQYNRRGGGHYDDPSVIPARTAARRRAEQRQPGSRNPGGRGGLRACFPR